MRALRFACVTLICLIAIFAALVYALTWHPKPREAAALSCPADTPSLQAGQTLKVMTWNIQYLAGKGYVFWYDLLDESGPDERPSAEAIARTLDDVVSIIRDEKPDLVLLQEVHDGAKATGHQNQLELLQARLGQLYPCSSEAFYWKAAWVPHPRILGSVGMKLATLSRFQISSAERRQLPLIPTDPITQQFNLKRALLLTEMPVKGDKPLIAINTHLDAFAQGYDTMQKQVAMTRSLLDSLTENGQSWVIGGDFNLLPPGQYEQLPEAQRAYFQPHSELATLWNRYPMIPSIRDGRGAHRQQWYTHYPNDPAVSGPDRTLDYLFYSPRLYLQGAYVRQHDTLNVSDHLPVLALFALPPALPQP